MMRNKDDNPYKKDTFASEERVVKNSANGLIKGSKVYSLHQGNKYKIAFDTSSHCKVNVFNKDLNQWAFRLDIPHRGAEFNHININQKVSGVPDPHIKLPPGGIHVGKGVARFCQVANKVNKVVFPIACAIDAARTGYSVYEDVSNKTTRNTVETVANLAGSWGGGFGGAVGGATIGTAVCPVVGTIIGGIIGSVCGSIGGSIGASYITETIGDALDYDVEERVCKKCRRKFKVRKYRGEHSRYCLECSS